MKFKESIIGEGKPHITIVGCIHGDEILGQKVLRELKKTRIKKGTLHLLLANPEAVKAKKRFMQRDLNRSFPGKKTGRKESRLAYELHEHLKKMDIVIDIHATTSHIGKLIICTSLNASIKKILSHIPIDRIAIMRKKVFGERSLISNCKLGVSIEYESGKNYLSVTRDVRMILRNLDLVSGNKQRFSKKNIYNVTEQYNVPETCKINKTLHEYALIKKGQVVGHVNKKPLVTPYSFYPLFLGAGRYKKTLCLIAKTKKTVTV